MQDFSKEPIMNIQWRDSATLLANSWNPNNVFSQELRLLERSIMLTGFVQPVLCTPDNIIIDGFHRTMLSQQSDRLKAKYNGMVPCAVLDIPKPQAMVLTIRMNRAKGSHIAARMSLIIRELIQVHHYDVQEICAEIGATPDEVDLLCQEGVFQMKDIANYSFSKAWYPRETGVAGKRDAV